MQLYLICGHVLYGTPAFIQQIEETTPINTAFKTCFSRRENELLNRLPSEVRILCF
jgi:hypothetical protein